MLVNGRDKQFISNKTYSIKNLVRTYEFWSHFFLYDCSPYTKEWCTLKKSWLPIEKLKGLLHLSASDVCMIEDVFNNHSSQNFAHCCW